ncbi:MAG: ATP-dependent Clp protease ATP-binding subunit [Nanoarchaeota archaeon]
MDRRAFGPEDEDDSNIDKIKKNSKSDTPILDHYGKDLTDLAKKGLLDPVVGRELEVDKLIQILNKRKKNNPVLVGEAGVGKTAIAEGLALRIANKQVDRWLFNKRIIELNFTSIVSGTKYRGEFEQRMEDILKELKKSPDVIIFIDELHNVVGAGGASGSMDASNIIKPALARGEVKMIGATTVDEYKKIIESDSALERRFQKIYVNIPGKEETLQILKQLREKYENYHNVIYSDEVLEKCVELTDRYINYRNFPDKAIDALDEVGSRVKLNNTSVPESIKKLEKELDAIVVDKKDAAKNQRYEDAAKFRDKEREMIAKIEEETIKWEEKLKENKTTVTVYNVAEIISNHTGIPLNKLTDDENQKLVSMEEYLSKRVIGQEEAVTKVCEAIQRSRLGIQDPNKPIASFLLLGSTGVGKTHLAKQLAKFMFHKEDAFIRFDMSEYMEKFTVSKLIGSPPGYVGYDDRGLLTEAVKNKPYSIILFDEIEKAHPDIFNIFLQVLDDGVLTDSTGREINFKNTIIIMTSNIGTDRIFSKKTLGFGVSSDEHADISAIVGDELKKHLRPELINRIDEKIVFNPLKEKDIALIVELELERTLSRIAEKGYDVSVAKSVKDYLTEIGYDKEYGARPLKRAITTHVENVISQCILKDGAKEGDKIKLSYDKKLQKVIAKI